jgi:hypothetical protein
MDEQPADTSTSASRKRITNLALIVAVAPVVAAAIRIWLYSGGDSGLFLTLLRTINVPAILIGTSILIIPSLMIIGAFALVTDRNARTQIAKRLPENKAMETIVGPIVIIVLVYTTPWVYLVMVLLVLAVAVAAFFANRAWRKRHPVDPAKERFWDRFDSIPMLLSVVVLFLVSQSSMWLPLERVAIDQTVRVGYVLESTGECSGSSRFMRYLAQPGLPTINEGHWAGQASGFIYHVSARCIRLD